ncbi:branched-chain amino acid ABC transporter permease [Nitriliruptor alkaliphilus]|uniref:branched-chain amino acid ABC transporter permease n=1 Tax=Nitriliruptor alkaliphilus TaxID=427918 RepID=UPI0009F88549|nr:branched-chain amino acid ABC transporter permease [Nitriliruptor alkaliphilus]
MSQILADCRRPTVMITAAVMALLAAAPLLGASNYSIAILTSLLGFMLLGMSINLVAGHAGLLTLAHAAYAGVGAYASVLVSRNLTHSALVQLAAAVVAATAVAAATGWIAVRAYKMYFLMLSLAIGELLFRAAMRWRSFTGGNDGLGAGAPMELVPGTPILLSGYVYWLAFLVFAVCAGLVLLVVRSPFGSSLRGIRDNEERMRGLGYSTAYYKYAVWTFSGAIAGAAGWILAAQMPRFITPATMSFHLSALLLLAVIIAGRGSMWGGCVGVAIVILMTDVVSQDLGGHGPLLLGLIFVLAVYLVPHGLAGIGRERRRRRKEADGPPEPSRPEDAGEPEPAKEVTT